MNTIEHIKDLVVQLQNSGKSTGKFHYVNKLNETDTVNSLEEAFERKLDLSKYEKREIFEKDYAEMVKIITGSKFNKITLDELKTIEQFYHICRDLSKDVVFPKLLKRINTNISRNQDHKKDKELRIERVMLYLQYGIVPQKSFTDLEQYKQAFQDYYSGKPVKINFN